MKGIYLDLDVLDALIEARFWMRSAGKIGITAVIRRYKFRQKGWKHPPFFVSIIDNLTIICYNNPDKIVLGGETCGEICQMQNETLFMNGTISRGKG